jgi:hypothetical protein
MSAVREIGKGYYALDTEGIKTIAWEVRSAVRDAFKAAKAELAHNYKEKETSRARSRASKSSGRVASGRK